MISTVRRIFSNLLLITSHKKQMKQNFVIYQYYNKVTFLQLSAYKTNKQTSVCLFKSQNKQEKDQSSKNTLEWADPVKIIYIKTNNNNDKNHIINIMVHHFCFCLFVFSNAFCLAPHFHMACLCAKQQKAQSSERKNCHHQQLIHRGHFVVPSSLLSGPLPCLL